MAATWGMRSVTATFVSCCAVDLSHIPWFYPLRFMQEYKFLMQYFDNFNAGLTCDGFISAYKYIFESRSCDEAQLWEELKSVGYNTQLELVGARSFVISVQTDSPTKVRACACVFVCLRGDLCVARTLPASVLACVLFCVVLF